MHTVIDEEERSNKEQETDGGSREKTLIHIHIPTTGAHLPAPGSIARSSCTYIPTYLSTYTVVEIPAQVSRSLSSP